MDKKYHINVKHISRPIIEQLTLEQNIDKYDAADMLYNSEVFAELSDENTKLYQKSWQEIYEMLKKELKHRPEAV